MRIVFTRVGNVVGARSYLTSTRLNGSIVAESPVPSSLEVPFCVIFSPYVWCTS